MLREVFSRRFGLSAAVTAKGGVAVAAPLYRFGSRPARRALGWRPFVRLGMDEGEL
jgi:hypothetical protein